MSDRANIFSQIHEIVFHGNGGYSWQEVYDMPIWLRKFTFNKIKDWHEKKNDTQQKEKTTELLKPQIDPTYNTKAPKK